MAESFDVLIIGAGPSGLAAAGYSALAGHRVLLVEKARVPRDKACGDALGQRALAHIFALGADRVLDLDTHFRFRGFLITSPDGSSARLGLSDKEAELVGGGYVIPRVILDAALLESIRETVETNHGEIRTQTAVSGVIWEAAGDISKDARTKVGDHRRVAGIRMRTGSGSTLEAFAPIIIGAGGANCPIARAVLANRHRRVSHEREHWGAAYRAYWRDIAGCGDTEGDLEIHFLKDILPGYLWIFPVGDGTANVGVGVRLDQLRQHPLKLRSLLNSAIESHPALRNRFENAKPIDGSGRGALLPLGSPRRNGRDEPRTAYAKGALLVGDAASLVDPLTGEGIGNALISAHLAASFATEAIASGGCSLSLGRRYQAALWKKLGWRLAAAHVLQRFSASPRALNLVVGRIGRWRWVNALLRTLLTPTREYPEL